MSTELIRSVTFGGIEWYEVQIKFYENRSICSEIVTEIRETGCLSSVLSHKEGEYGKKDYSLERI